MSETKPQCIHCGRTSDEVPLLNLKYQTANYWICPVHLPIVIHKPHMLVGKLPGAENLASENHEH